LKNIVVNLKIHTPWYRYSNKKYSLEEFDNFLSEIHHFECGEICSINISNCGVVSINFKDDLSENQLKEFCSIFIYFVSVCNGYNCEFDELAIIDEIPIPHFFSYAKEDETTFPLLKNIKFYEISLEDINSIFGDIICKLFSANKLVILSLLSNYYSIVFYKDFIGNGIHKFRNIVANIESIITTINAKKYLDDENENKEYFAVLNNISGVSKSKLKKHLSFRRVSLEEKLKDSFEYMEKFGLRFKLNVNKECKKIADTRNFVSHLFETDKEYLSETEISDYTAVFEEMFRMLFLEYCGVSYTLIGEKFLRNAPICIKLKKCFDIETK